MPTDKHIIEAHQAAQLVVLDDTARPITEEVLALALVDVEAQRTDVVGLERRNHGRRVHQRAARRVDDDDAALRQRERAHIQHVPRLRRQRAVQRDDVGLAQGLVQRRVRDAVQRRGGRVGARVVGQDAAAEALGQDLARQHADLAGADEGDGLAVEVLADEAGEREVALARAVEGLVVLAHDGQEEADGELGHGVRRVRGHVDDLDA